MVPHLTVDFSWNREDTRTCLPLICALFFFTAYWFVAQSEKIKNYFYNKYPFDQASYRHIFFSKLMGFVLMGIFPISICLIFLKEYSLRDYGLAYIPETAFFSLIWTICLAHIVIPLAYFSARKEKNWINYPQIRSAVWTPKIAWIDACGWFIYLFGYEFLFRGVLLFPLADGMGVWPAIAVNIALYSATHIPKGLDETIGAIPLGFVLCILTLYSGTIWIAFLVHVFMAWTNSFTALKYNPATRYVRKKELKSTMHIEKNDKRK